MIIGVDFRFGYKSNRGMGTYAREIVKCLVRMDMDNRYILYIDNGNACEHFVFPENVSFRKLKGGYFSYEQYYLPRQAKKDGVVLLWCPYNTFPLYLSSSIKLYVTVHDLIFMGKLRPKGIYQLLGKYYRCFNLRMGIRRIDELFTVSDYSAHLLSRYFHRKAYVTPNHVKLEDVAYDEQEERKVLEKFGVREKQYYYTITGDAPSKNIFVLKKVMTDLDDNVFVVTGIRQESWKACPAHVRVTGFVTEKEKNVLLKNAKAFLFLSLEEGFGIPLLEAMRFDCKILASDCSVIPEIVGGGGYCVKPVEEEIRRAIKSFDVPEWGTSEGRRRQLAKYSSWEQSAIILRDVMKKERDESAGN